MSSVTNYEGNQSHQLSSQRILIVEDDPIMQLGLKQFFADKSQFQIVGTAADGYVAVEKAQKLQPELVIMDIGLPHLDGIGATQQIKQNTPQIRVVMLTSHQTEIETIAALASGADAYCIKGTSLDQLLIAMAAAEKGAIYLDPLIARKAIGHLKLPTTNNNLISQLSPRELEILKLIAEGSSNPLVTS